jgi:hypothetical protein
MNIFIWQNLMTADTKVRLIGKILSELSKPCKSGAGKFNPIKRSDRIFNFSTKMIFVRRKNVFRKTDENLNSQITY